MKDDRVFKWGILGCGWIASCFADDLVYVKDAELAAVGSRSKDKAEAFAAKYGAARAYGSYEELAADPDIDAVYVATPHPAHRDNVMTCLRAGKAVLCEKPFTINGGEAEEMIRYARENRLFLMEAMWTRYLPTIIKVREWLKAGRIGEPRLVKADFGFRIDWNPQSRLLDPALGGGALLDAGIYPLSFASMIFGSPPIGIHSTAHLGETGVDEHFSLLLEYEGGRAASLNGAVRLAMTNEALIYGTEGYIRVPNFLSGKEAYLHPRGGQAESFEDDREARGYRFEAEEVARCLREGRTESGIMPLDETLELMRTMDVIRAQWGLKYPSEQ